MVKAPFISTAVPRPPLGLGGGGGLQMTSALMNGKVMLVVFVGFVGFFFPERDQYYRRLFLRVCSEGSTVRRFLEKPGIKPATSGLQGK